MNYEKIYYQLIEKRQNEILTKNICYCEKHHIMPTSFGGSNNVNNIVCLTAREHYIAHLLLMKISEYKYGKDSNQYLKMVKAVLYFGTCNTNKKLVNRKVLSFNSRIYENIRNEFSQIQKKIMKEKFIGNKNPMYGRKRTIEEKAKIRKTRLERGCGKGKKNSMYGKSCTYKMTQEQYIAWKTKIRNTAKTKKFRHIYNINTLENKRVPENELQLYLNNGYILGQYNKNRRSTKGMKKVCLPIKNAKQIWIQQYELQTYLDNGYIQWKNRLK